MASKEVRYSQGMTNIWSDGEKIIVKNAAGTKWVKDNVEQIFGMGEWDSIHDLCYSEQDDLKEHRRDSRAYECISGYIPQRVFDDLAKQVKEDVDKAKILGALKNVR
jgi:hypothetical protein